MTSKKRKTPECANEKEEEQEAAVTTLDSATNSIVANGTSINDAGDEEVNEEVNDDDDNDDDDDDVSSSDDDLILEGVVVRNYDVSDEEDYDDEDDEGDEVEDDDNDPQNEDSAGDRNLKQDTTTPSNNGTVTTRTKGQGTEKLPPKSNTKKKKKVKKKKRNDDDDDDDTDDVLNVDFTFCDMDEKYFHGIKSLLHSSSVFHQSHSSPLTDLMIENVAIGTVVSTAMEDVNEPDVFGFGSVLNIKTYQDQDTIQFIKKFCLQHCPATVTPQQKQELDVCFSGTTKRPVGLFLHGRMINMPMEIVHVLHEQLIQDLDWAIQNANMDDTEDERKAHDFGAFVRLAPGERDPQSHHTVLYKYFDDEILMGRSEFHYVVDVTSSSSSSSSSSRTDHKQCMVVMVLTKTGHRLAINDLKQLIHGR